MEDQECKSCGGHFKENVILKHIVHSTKCSRAYSTLELNELKTKAKEKAKLRQIEYRKENKEQLAKKKSEYYLQNQVEIKAKQRDNYHKKKSKKSVEKIQEKTWCFCKSCKKKFKINAFLKHLANAQNCENDYTEDEIKNLKACALERAKLRKKAYKFENCNDIREKKRLYYLKNQDSIKASRKKTYYIKKCEREQNSIPDEKGEQEKNSKINKTAKDKKNEEFVLDTLYDQSKECKGCGKSFKSNVFLKHVTHSKHCRDSYSEKDICDLKKEASEKASLRNFEYKLKNPEKMRAMNKVYYLKNQEQRKAFKKEQYKKLKADEEEYKKMKADKQEKYQQKKIQALRNMRNGMSKWLIFQKIRSAREENFNSKKSISNNELEEISKLQKHGIDEQTNHQLQKMKTMIEEKYSYYENEINNFEEAAENVDNLDDLIFNYSHLNKIGSIWWQLRKEIQSQLTEASRKFGFQLKCFNCRSDGTKIQLCLKCNGEKLNH